MLAAVGGDSLTGSSWPWEMPGAATSVAFFVFIASRLWLQSYGRRHAV